jgi:membrane protein DedA with SNARE-associated domain
VAHSIDFIVRHGYALLFFWILAEQAGLPLPSLPLLLACGAMMRDGRVKLHVAVLVAAGACFLADNVWYIIGRRGGGRVLRFLCKVSLEPDSCVRRTENVFLRYGSRSLLVAKFVPGFNAVAAPLAAVSGIGHARFILFDTLGALLWIVTCVGLGFVFSNQLDEVFDYLERTGVWFGVVVAALLAAWIVGKYLQRRRFMRKLAVARITPQELRAKLEAGEELVVVDVRHLLDDADAIPGALRIPLEDLEQNDQLVPRDRDIILFCS